MKVYLLIFCCCSLIAAFAQDSSTLTIKLIKQNFKEDTLTSPVLSKITLQCRYRDTAIMNFEVGKNMQWVNDSMIIIPNLKPGIYFFRPYTKNTRLAMPYYVQRLVVCTKCNATIKLPVYYIAVGERREEDEERILTEYNTPGYSKVYWEINNGFNGFLKSSYLDSVRKDFFGILRKREKKKISGVPFTITGFITPGKETVDITVSPVTIAPRLKGMIIRGFKNIQFSKQHLPPHADRLKWSQFAGEKITIKSYELFE